MQRGERHTPRFVRTAAALVAVLLLTSCAEIERRISTTISSAKFWEREPKPAPARPVKVAGKDMVREIQKGLTALGYRVGPADGITGRRTRIAIRKYERKHRLKLRGRPTQALLAHVRGKIDERRKAEERKIAAEKEKAEAESAPPPSPPRSSAPAPLPTYEAGTVYIYQDGRIERVIGVSGGKVKWRRNDGTSFSADRNFLLPWTYWETGEQRGKVLLWTSRNGEMWPRVAGQRMSYKATVTVMNRAGQGRPRNSAEEWACRNQGHERLSVTAGTFDTIRFVCTHAVEGSEKPATRTWYYAPRIRHYVRFEERKPNSPSLRRSDLVAVRPTAAGWPPVVRAALEEHLVAALKNQPDGGKVRWTSSGIPTRVTVEMSTGFVDNKRRTCRRFTQVWSRNGMRRVYPGAACRSASGRWVVPVPRLEKNRRIAIASDRY